MDIFFKPQASRLLEPIRLFYFSMKFPLSLGFFFQIQLTPSRV